MDDVGIEDRRQHLELVEQVERGQQAGTLSGRSSFGAKTVSTGFIMFLRIFKPVYNDHLREAQKVVIVHRWLFYIGILVYEN